MPRLVMLPATEPGDRTYGEMPVQIAGYDVMQVVFPKLVWYNRSVCDEAIRQIRGFGDEPVVLVGFSKSGLGAWTIARTIPDCVAATVIFDAPMVREEVPPWGTSPFYPDTASWQEDLPSRTIDAFEKAVPESHRLVLISGRSFHDEMVAMAMALRGRKITHRFLARPDMRHHWESGWLEAGLGELEARW